MNNALYKTVVTTIRKQRDTVKGTDSDARPPHSDLKVKTPVRLLISLSSRFISALLVYYSWFQPEKMPTSTIVLWFYFVVDDLVKGLFLSHNRLTGRSLALRTNLVSGLGMLRHIFLSLFPTDTGCRILNPGTFLYHICYSFMGFGGVDLLSQVSKKDPSLNSGQTDDTCWVGLQ